MSGIRRGEIYYIESIFNEQGSEQRAGRPAIIVSNDKANASSMTLEVVYLTTKPKADLPTHVSIRSAQRESIALCEQIASVSVERVGSYCGTCTDAEMEAMDVAMMISLGMSFSKQPEKNSGYDSKAVAEVEKQCADLESRCKEQDAVISGQKELLVRKDKELVAASAKCDMLKEMYDSLLEKVAAAKAV